MPTATVHPIAATPASQVAEDAALELSGVVALLDALVHHTAESADIQTFAPERSTAVSNGLALLRNIVSEHARKLDEAFSGGRQS